MNSQIKKGLGRGLSSLIGETKVETKTNKLSLSDIIPNKFQPRKNFDEENLNELKNQLKNVESYSLLLLENQDRITSKYEIIAGEEGG